MFGNLSAECACYCATGVQRLGRDSLRSLGFGPTQIAQIAQIAPNAPLARPTRLRPARNWLSRLHNARNFVVINGPKSTVVRTKPEALRGAARGPRTANDVGGSGPVEGASCSRAAASTDSIRLGGRALSCVFRPRADSRAAKQTSAQTIVLRDIRFDDLVSSTVGRFL